MQVKVIRQAPKYSIFKERGETYLGKFFHGIFYQKSFFKKFSKHA